MTQSQFSVDKNLAASDDDRITYFAVTDTRNKRTPFGIKRQDRSRHMYVIGKTGMGKSTLLENMAIQDMQNGEGLCFIDPHGGTAEKLLDYVPEERIKDVLYFAPFDMQYPISFNVLENVDADKRHFVVAGLMSTFEKIWVDAWSARMAYILQNTLAALLEFPGATLLGVNRMYIDKEYRKNVIANITDPSVRSFWVDEYSKYTDRYAQEATPAIQNKIGQFASNALVRNIIGQPHSAFDARKLADERKIFIVNLSKGRVGEGNANLLGSMLITKVYLAAMSRADVSAQALHQLPDFFLYVDEFQNFANRSFADILSEARKYKLSLTIAHQYIEQMEEEVRAAVFGNVGSMMTFRVGAYDAEVLEKEFAPIFTADDLVNLGRFQLYLKLMIDGVSSQPFSAVTMPPIEEPSVSHRDQAIAYSRAQFSQPREEVENTIKLWVDKKYEDPEAKEKERARQERRAARDSGGPSSAGSRPPRERMSGPRDTSHSAPRPQTRTDRRDAPRRPRTLDASGPETRDMPRRPLSPKPTVVRTEEHGVELRNILTHMVGDSAQGKTTSSQAPVPAQERGPGPGPEVLVHERRQGDRRAPVPARDDGKSVTDEGKQQLRNLLSSLTKAPQEPITQTAPAGPKPKPSVHVATQKKAASSVGPSTPELPQEKLKEMLRVEKPTIEE